MGTLGITCFEDLLGHLDGLTDAARRSHVDPEAVDFLVTIRRRLVVIHNFIHKLEPDAEPRVETQEKIIADTDECLEYFGNLTEAARGAGLSSTITHYLHTARLRLRFSLRGRDGRRIVNRDDSSGIAQIRWIASGKEMREEVEVADSSAYGVGITGRNPLAPDTVVQLTTEEDGRRRRFDCLAVYCEQQGLQYQIGLEIFAIRQ